MRVLGIDEAGRGCVLGPMVVAGFVAEGLPDDILRIAGAADSKTLTPEKRTAARGRLEPLGRWEARAVPATDIDEENLNALEERIIVDLVDQFDPDVVLCDALGHPRTLEATVTRLRGRLRRDRARWLMEPKADGTYATVGAASIFAKTTRDAALDELRTAYGPLGSGYPGDPITRAWLEGWQASGRPWPGFVRTRWGTIRALAQVALFAEPPPPPEPAKKKKVSRSRESRS
jgi:ribonuclease HII